MFISNQDIGLDIFLDIGISYFCMLNYLRSHKSYTKRVLCGVDTVILRSAVSLFKLMVRNGRVVSKCHIFNIPSAVDRTSVSPNGCIS